MGHHLNYEVHTHIHHHIYDEPPTMTTLASSTATQPSTPTEMEALVALVVCLSTASMDVVRLAAKVQAKIPAVVALEAAAAHASATAAADAAAQASPVWGSGETWYVVICGRKPGMYRTAKEANDNCDGVPNQLKQKKTSRLEALAWYRQLYNGPHGATGVQKWTPA
ncbi:hypothetical protein B0H14DRAFT_3425590 [Mycena olivaceomarginata]|nr:hypothetical protein B0H14DRAFT_3425590 [Mycena olivaceomarginata]